VFLSFPPDEDMVFFPKGIFLFLVLIAAIQRTGLADTASPSVTASIQLDQLAQFALYVSKKTLVSRSNRGCTLEKLQVRRNWRAFSVGDKKIYIKAVICLQALPSRTPSYLAPGAKTRYDDFVATHINQTLFIHRTVGLSSPF
jgi:tyrosinase